MRISLFFFSYLFFAVQQLNSQSVLLKEQVLRSVLRFQQEGLVDLPAKQLPSLRKSPSLSDTSWKSSPFFQLAIQTAYALSIGKPIKPWFAYESISIAQEKVIYKRLESALEKVQTSLEVENYFASYRQPRSAKTRALFNTLVAKKKQFVKSPSRLLSDTILWLEHAVGVYHWMDHWDFTRSIHVNVAAAEVELVEEDRTILSMRAVVGKAATPTPFFAAWAENIVLYPYWFVPLSIAVGEFLPKIKKDITWLDRQNMQVLDRAGNVVDPTQLPWADFTAAYFPYTIRQSTGCDNALGILKVDVKTPLGVYLHDTNNKASFLLSKRFLSHGCIRLEEPLQLGNYLLDKTLDTVFLQSCLLEQKPVQLTLKAAIPVLVFYTLVQPQQDGSVRYLQDTYQHFQKK